MASDVLAFRFTDLVGRWRLRFTEELRAFVDASVRRGAPAHLVDTAMAEAFREAEGAEFEICGDGRFVSRAHGVDLLTAAIPVRTDPMRELSFEKAPGQRVDIRIVGEDEVRVLQTGKPEMRFTRVRSSP